MLSQLIRSAHEQVSHQYALSVTCRPQPLAVISNYHFHLYQNIIFYTCVVSNVYFVSDYFVLTLDSSRRSNKLKVNRNVTLGRLVS